MASYGTLPNLKARINKTDAGDDVTLTALLESMSRAIDRFCNRSGGEFMATDDPEARFYRGSGANWQQIDECISVSQVAVKASVSAATYEVWTSPTTNLAGDGDWLAFSADPDDPDFNTLPYDALLVDLNGVESVFTGWRSADDFYFGGGLYSSRRTGRKPSPARVPTVRVTARWGYSATAPTPITEATYALSAILYKRFEGSMASALANVELGGLEVFRTIDPAVEFLLALGRFIKPAVGRK